MTNWDEMTPRERVRQVSAMLSDYSRTHTYTDWEHDHLLGLVQVLDGSMAELDEDLKKARRTAGGLQTKTQRQGDELRALESHLEGLEEENSVMRGYIRAMLEGNLKTIEEARAELNLKPWGQL